MNNSARKSAENVSQSTKAEPIKGCSAKWKKVREEASVWYTTLGALGTLYMLYQLYDRYGVYAFIILAIFLLIVFLKTECYLSDEQIITIKIIVSIEKILQKNNINEQSNPEIKELKKLIQEFENI